MKDSVNEYLWPKLSTSFKHYLLPGSYKALGYSFWRCRLVVGLPNSSGESNNNNVTSKCNDCFYMILIVNRIFRSFYPVLGFG